MCAHPPSLAIAIYEATHIQRITKGAPLTSNAMHSNKTGTHKGECLPAPLRIVRMSAMTTRISETEAIYSPRAVFSDGCSIAAIDSMRLAALTAFLNICHSQGSSLCFITQAINNPRIALQALQAGTKLSLALLALSPSR